MQLKVGIEKESKNKHSINLEVLLLQGLNTAEK